MKKVLYIILILVVIALIIPALMPNDFTVERQVNISRPVDVVFPMLKSLKTHNNWSVWASMDPDMKQEFRGTDGTVGFVSAWEGNDDVGKGEQEITAIIENQRIDFELRFIKPWEATNQVYLITDQLKDNATSVRWGLTGSMPYPMNAMMLFYNMEDEIGNDFDKGLQNLKNLIESMPMPEIIEPEINDNLVNTSDTIQ